MKTSYEVRYGSNRKKRNGSWRKDRRRLEAQERQKVYNELSTEKKIALAKSRPGNSAREVARLEAMLGKEN